MEAEGGLGWVVGGEDMGVRLCLFRMGLVYVLACLLACLVLFGRLGLCELLFRRSGRVYSPRLWVWAWAFSGN